MMTTLNELAYTRSGDKGDISNVGIMAFGAAEYEALRTWVTPERLRSFFARGVDEGKLRPEVDYEQLIEMITGGMFVSDALRDDVPEEWAPNLVALMWPTISR